MIDYENFQDFLDVWGEGDSGNILTHYDFDYDAWEWSLIIIQPRKVVNIYVSINGAKCGLALFDELDKIQKFGAQSLQGVRSTLRSCRIDSKTMIHEAMEKIKK